MYGRQKIVDSLLRNLPNVEGAVAFSGKGVGVEGYKRIPGAMLFERVIKGQKTREVSCVCDESSPDS